MRSIALILLILAALLVSANPAHAGTELEGYQKQVRKFTTPFGTVHDKPKSLCVCLDPGPEMNAVGMLQDWLVTNSVDRVRVLCHVVRFVPSTGALTGNFYRCLDWTPLGK